MQLNESTWNLIYTYGTRVGGVIVLLFVAYVVAGFVRRTLLRSLGNSGLDETLSRFLANMARYAVLIMAVLACLGMFGVETTSFAAVIGASTLAIGLAFQGSLSNFASGVMLLVFRPFKVGDVISVGGHTGKIEEIELFTTKMTTPDNRLVIHPNKGVFGATIVNITHNTTRRVDIDVGVDYSANIDQTRAILEAAAQRIPQSISEPAPQVVLANLGASSVDWTIRVWTNTPDYLAVKESMLREIKMALDAADIGIPFPQMDVHFDAAAVAMPLSRAS